MTKKHQDVIGLFRGGVGRTRPIYRGIVRVLETALADGTLSASHRLPPERDLAEALRVSRTTVVTAYRELESKGLVRGFVGRGTFVAARPDSSSAPFAWRGKVSASALQSNDATVRDLVRAAGDPKVVSYAAGQPALESFPAAAFQRAMNVLIEREPMTIWRNGPTEGQWRFREAIASRFGGHPEQILVIAGAQQGLDLLVRCLVDPGDSVIIERPGYLGAVHSFRTAGARLIGWDIRRADVDELEELLLRYRPKLMYLNPTHQNPTGCTLPIRTRREVLQLAERYRVPIVEDDTYRELSLSGTPPPSLYVLDERRTTVIHLNTFSKMLAPGLRLGWIAAVPPIVEQLSLIKQRVDLHPQNLSQLAISELIETGVFDRHLDALRVEHRRRRDAMVKALAKHISPERIRFDVPDGGLFLWCRLGGSVQARTVQLHAQKHSMVFVPGEAFYADGAGTEELRLCFTSQPAARAEEAARWLSASIEAASHNAKSLTEVPVA
ncbi:MAG TPA: PLP-dependent aminotransferase family protein [Vicinamibacterales bacterium]|nr:PLP-dependent aminotransferase family protein [Vicinamibacterales bacterium]